MTVRVLIVDDSRFIRRQVARILTERSDIEIVGEACNGLEAVEKVLTLAPDVVTMDVQMPVMDGITAVRKIMKSTPVPIMMFSVATREGAQETLDALEAGALDFLPKQLEDLSPDRVQAGRLIRARVKSLANRSLNTTPCRNASVIDPSVIARSVPSKTIRTDCSLLVIAASTGGLWHSRK